MSDKDTGTVSYSVHPSVAYSRRIIENLPTRTGRALDDWVRLARASGPTDAKELLAWLKSNHGLGGTTAKMVADHTTGTDLDAIDDEAYLAAAPADVAAMYSGPRAALRAIHDRLIALALTLGEDVRISPCKTIVPLYRRNVFAEIKPATNKRVDLGLALRAHQGRLPARILAAPGLTKGDRIAHRIPLAAETEIDEEVGFWLRTAYDLDN